MCKGAIYGQDVVDSTGAKKAVLGNAFLFFSSFLSFRSSLIVSSSSAHTLSANFLNAHCIQFNLRDANGKPSLVFYPFSEAATKDEDKRCPTYMPYANIGWFSTLPYEGC
ncbi:hypothetical protein JCM8547_006118 [Rhodosporidiobolus lusitaniae]